MASRAPASAAPEPAAPVAAPTPSRHREGRRVRTALKISSPADAAEREAETTAKRIVAMPAPQPLGPVAQRLPLQAARAPVVPVPRPPAPAGAAASPRPAPPGDVGPELETAIRQQLGGGRPLPADVASFMAPRFKADFGGVRIHTDARAANLATRLGARAFTFGRDIFFNSGQFQPGGTEGMELIAHELTHTIQQREVVQRAAAEAAPVEVHETSAPQVQRGIVSEALDWIADKANYIPGFRLFTIIIGVNPVNMSRVDRSGANILRALVEFLPGGGLIVEALDRYGIFERAGSWIEEQFRTLGMVGSMFRDALMQFIDSLGWRDIFRLGSVWDRAKRIFTEPVDRLIDFGRGLVTGVLRFIREAILRPLAALAEGTRGYPLLKAVLGEDPVTGEPVPRTADTLIGGFMTLIGQQEIWENIKKANAIARAWAWFQNALSGLMGLVRSIPGRFMDTLRSLEIMDLVLPPRAFLKVGRAFASFLGDFMSWAGGTVLNLLQIIFEVVAPAAVPYIRRAAGAFTTILRNPIRFIGTLVRAGIQGFRQFGRNFLSHLRTALIQWLTGAMSGTRIYIPAGFSLVEILKFILSVLGLTWVNIRAKLVRATNETVVRAMETGFDLVRTLVTRGPAAAWEQIVQSVTNLRDMVIEQVMTYVRDRIISVAIQTLVTSLNPAGAFIQAIIAIYNTIMFFVERLRQIAQVAAGVIDSIAAIAAGTIGPAAARVEQTMAGLLVLVISFLARIARLGNVSVIVTRFLDRVRAPIDRGLDRVVTWIVAQARRLGRFIAQAGVPHDPNERLRLASRAAVAAARRLSGRITQPVLNAALAAVRLRYGLTAIEVFQRAGKWWARATINPSLEQDLGLPTGETRGRAGAASGAAAARAVPINVPKQASPLTLADGESHVVYGAVSNGRVSMTMASGVEAELAFVLGRLRDICLRASREGPASPETEPGRVEKIRQAYEFLAHVLNITRPNWEGDNSIYVAIRGIPQETRNAGKSAAELNALALEQLRTFIAGISGTLVRNVKYGFKSLEELKIKSAYVDPGGMLKPRFQDVRRHFYNFGWTAPATSFAATEMVRLRGEALKRNPALASLPNPSRFYWSEDVTGKSSVAPYIADATDVANNGQPEKDHKIPLGDRWQSGTPPVGTAAGNNITHPARGIDYQLDIQVISKKTNIAKSGPLFVFTVGPNFKGPLDV